MAATATRQLAEVILGQPLEDWVVARREGGMSWSALALELRLSTKGRVQLNRETLRVWFRDVDPLVQDIQ